METLAIVGGGPRGLFALESIFVAVFNNKKDIDLKVVLFEPYNYPGSGWVWCPEQISTNWLNITERGLQNLQGRPEIRIDNHIIPEFPSYSQWLPKEEQNPDATVPDRFPSRAKLGTYLNERYETIKNTLCGINMLSVINERVINIKYHNPHFHIHTGGTSPTEVDELVLTIGHQDTQLSDQLQEWEAHVTRYKQLILTTDAYPIEKIMSKNIGKDDTVAFRGFGLAMIDQVRALTIKSGGHFTMQNDETKEVTYTPSKEHSQHFISFSLNGLPMVPKPISAFVDKNYEPSEQALTKFGRAIQKGARGEHPAHNHYFLIEAIAAVVAPVFMKLGDFAITHDLTEEEIELLVINYIANKDIDHDLLLSRDMNVLLMMKEQVAMATNNTKVSLDYCVGQVWRHCQPTIYKEFSYPTLQDGVIAEVIALDEGSKRYTYGPPVESIQQLIALHSARLLNLDFVNNPDIELVDSGWKLTSGTNEVTANVMLNAVLDAPQLVKVNSPIVQNLLHNDIIEPLHTELGVRTDEYGYVVTPEGKDFVPLTVLGRLSKGSVIGVDAILECFGSRITNWAERSVLI